MPITSAASRPTLPADAGRIGGLTNTEIDGLLEYGTPAGRR
jgi:hypothetical protein